MDDVADLAGWHWLFILEGLPSVAVMVAVLLWLTDHPARTRWLSTEERAWLEDRLAAERREREKVRVYGVWESLRDPTVLLLGLLYLCIVVGLYGVGFWMPQILQCLGSFTTLEVGLLTAIPYGFAAVCIYTGLGPFWSLPSLFLTDTAAAAGIALINSIGNLGGFASPYLVGWLKQASSGFQSGLMALGAALALGGVLALVLGARILARQVVAR